jgi:hypothetical protein
LILPVARVAGNGSQFRDRASSAVQKRLSEGKHLVMNLASQVETVEMSEADLENVSGGLEAGGSGGLSVETPLADVCGGFLAVASTQGLAAGAHVHTEAL